MIFREKKEEKNEIKKEIYFYFSFRCLLSTIPIRNPSFEADDIIEL